MTVPAALSRPFRNPCAGLAATISTHVASSITDPVCAGNVPWTTRSTITISGSLGSFKFEREKATDSAGTSWQAWITSQNLTEDDSQGGGFFGSGGAGDPTERWFKARARIVAADESPCGSWMESSQIDKTANSCAG
jgi:hypothetical protein